MSLLYPPSRAFPALCLILLFLLLVLNYRDSLHIYQRKYHASSSDNNALSHSTRSATSALTKEEVASGELRLNQDNELLLDFIRLNHLTPPGTGKADISTSGDGMNWEQQEVFRFIINATKFKKGGFFIEAGANDGQYFSNTLQLELSHNWTGLLIEADPRPLAKLLMRNRHAWIVNACLSTTSYPKKIEMLQNTYLEGITFIRGYREFIGAERDYQPLQAQCFPLYSILKSINVTTIDYFSLDIEGSELDVLKTIPWESVFIKMLSIEVFPQYVEPVKNYMTSIGYTYVTFLQNGYSHDQIYIHKDA